MSRHLGRVEGSLNQPIVYQGFCRCGAKSPVFPHKAEADQWVDTHLVNAVRAQVHRGGRNPTLEDQAKWYRVMEAAASDQAEADQWGRLATELEHRLGADEHSQQDPMF